MGLQTEKSVLVVKKHKFHSRIFSAVMSILKTIFYVANVADMSVTIQFFLNQILKKNKNTQNN